MEKSMKRANILFLQHNFLLLWTGRTISVFGDLIFNTTLILWISTILARGQDWAPLAVGGISIAKSLPVLVLGLLAGVFVDRWNKRRTMVIMDLLRALLILLLIGLLPFHLLANWLLLLIYLVILSLSVCTLFFTPSSTVLFGDIISDEDWEQASGFFQLVTPLAAIIAPPIATFLFFTVGLEWALIFNALSFIISLILLIALRLPPQAQVTRSNKARPHLLKELGEGIRFYLKSSVLVTLLVVSVLIVIFDSIFGALGIFFVTNNLHASTIFYGFISTAAGAGAVVGALFSGIAGKYIGAARLLWLSTSLTGILILIFAHITNFSLALFFAFLIGIGMVATNVPIIPLMLQTTPRHLLGRAEAVLTPVMTLSALLAVAFASWLDSTVLHSFHFSWSWITFGPIDTIFSAAGVLTLLAGVYSFIMLRRLPPKQAPIEKVSQADEEVVSS